MGEETDADEREQDGAQVQRPAGKRGLRPAGGQRLRAAAEPQTGGDGGRKDRRVRGGDQRDHGYEGRGGEVLLRARYDAESRLLSVEVRDEGVGIEDVEKAREPLFTTRPDLERSGMGFAVMESFMDALEVRSAPGMGTSVLMKKRFD